MNENILTHNGINTSLENADQQSLIEPYLNIITSLVDKKTLSDSQKNFYTDLIIEFSKFNLGKFLLKNRGLNGFWADYLINYPNYYKQKKCDPYNNPIGELEKQLLEQLPITVATQKRHQIFKQICQKQLKDHMRILSLPCGLSSEILQLDFSKISDFELIAMDIDTESLDISKQRAMESNLDTHCIWLQEDAWNYSVDNLDLIISNGLTMYVANDDLVEQLYNKFYKSLNKGSMLVTSFINPPPYIDPNSVWKIDNIDPKFYEIQEILFNKIFEARWHGYRNQDLTKQLLMQAGFKADKIAFYPDDNNIFPTVTAIK